jgi:NADPH-dependent 2,4-dienoyl-CoA reductase/sulfur reductase-like enzyme
MNDDRVVVVGASLAGLRACETFRAEGFEGTITLIGDEPEVPYDRPPLSKKFLSGDWPDHRIRLRTPESFDELQLDLRLGVEATALDVDSRSVTLADGTQVAGAAVVIATGAAPRHLPGQPAWPGIHVLRTLADSARLRDELAEGVRVVVIGAGFIGLEVAATARQRGCEVTVLEGLPSPLVRALGAELGPVVAAVHGRHGIDVRCGVQVSGFDGGDGGVRGVVLAGGEVVPAEVVVVGVGVTPSTGWLQGSGLQLGDGIVCDAALQAAPWVWAAGDCARWPNLLFGDPASGEEMRVEHWTNAAEQGAHAARNVMAVANGEVPSPYSAVPFFWSDQFESRIQFVGRAHSDDEVHVFAGSTDGAFAALYGHGGRLRGVLGVSMPKMVMPFRALLSARAGWDVAMATAAAMVS